MSESEIDEMDQEIISAFKIGSEFGEMQLWLIKRLDGHDASYDEMEALVVRAETESVARFIASENAGDEDPNIWLDETETACIQLTADGPRDVIIVDFQRAEMEPHNS